MRWLVWRQHRVQGLFYLIALVVISTGLLIIGLTARKRAVALGIPECLKEKLNCSETLDKLSGYFHSIPPFTGLLLSLPIVLGMFVASPLLPREFEQGTHRLVWTQSISPTKWLIYKVALVFGTIGIASGLLGILVRWALRPLMPGFGGFFNSTWYDIQGVVPVGCAIFALSLGFAIGAVYRRTIPAIATTLFVYVAIRVPIHWVRGNFFPSKSLNTNIPVNSLVSNLDGGPYFDAGNSLSPNDWILGSTITYSNGTLIDTSTTNFSVIQKFCPDLLDSGTAQNKSKVSESCRSALDGINLHAHTRFQPASHFWAIQFVESAIFLGISALLVGATIYAIGKNRSRSSK